MVKQGQYAKAKRIKHLKNLQVKRHLQPGRTIADEQFAEFLLGRYVLTTRKDLPADARESGQRFLQELAPRLQENDGDEQAAVEAVLQFALGRVPWQFYRQVSQSWGPLQDFLHREVAAVPVAKRVLLKKLVSEEKLNDLIVCLLAKQAAAVTTINQGGQASQSLARQLEPALKNKQGGPAWDKVRQLIGPLPFNSEEAADQGTRDWLDTLQQL